MSESTIDSYDDVTIQSSKLSNSSNHHEQSIFIPHVRKTLKYVRSEDSIDSTDKIFKINHCVYCGTLEKHSTKTKCSPAKTPFKSEQPLLHSQPAKALKYPALNEVLSLPIELNCLSELCFSENLLFSCKKDETVRSFSENSNDDTIKNDFLDVQNLQTIGGFCLNMEAISDMNEIKIYVSSKFSDENENICTLSIFAKTDYNFRTIEEKRVEGLYDQNSGEKREKTLHVFQEYPQNGNSSSNSLIGIRSERIGPSFNEYTANVDVDELGHFMLDGVGFLFMRFLSSIRFTGIIDTFSMNLSGEICQSIYKCSLKNKTIFNGFLCDIIKIKRILVLKDCEPEMSTTYLLQSGHLLRHTWNQCNYVIHMNPLTKLPSSAMDLITNWKQDIDLLTIYFETKSKRSAEIKNFVENEPKVKEFVTDFLVSLLQKKPDRVVEYAKEYFTSMNNEQQNLEFCK